MTRRTPVTRRAFLGALGLGALGVAAACSGGSDERQTITVTEGPSGTEPEQTVDSDSDPDTSTSAPDDSAETPALPPASRAKMLELLFTTRMHRQRLAAAIDANERDAELLSMIRSDREAHEAVLAAEFQRIFGEPAPAEEGTADELGVSDPDEILGIVRGDATTAQNLFTDEMSAVSRFEAQIFGSIAASLATHRMVLS